MDIPIAIASGSHVPWSKHLSLILRWSFNDSCMFLIKRWVINKYVHTHLRIYIYTYVHCNSAVYVHLLYTYSHCWSWDTHCTWSQVLTMARIPATFVSWARLAVFMQQNKGPDRRFASQDAPKMRGDRCFQRRDHHPQVGKEILTSEDLKSTRAWDKSITGLGEGNC